jgi:hypothetical protein
MIVRSGMVAIRRTVTLRVLVLCATTVTTLGYGLTESYWFLLLPPVVLGVLAVLVRYWSRHPVGVPDKTRDRIRKRLRVQFIWVLAVLSGFLIYSIVIDRQHRALGYAILLIEQLVNIGVVIAEYIHTLKSERADY